MNHFFTQQIHSVYGPSGYIPGWGGGGKFSTNVYTGWLCPEVQPLTLLYTIFHGKGIHFVYFLNLLTNGIPFTYLVNNFAFLLTAVNALYFRNQSY